VAFARTSYSRKGYSREGKELICTPNAIRIRKMADLASRTFREETLSGTPDVARCRDSGLIEASRIQV